MISKKIVVWLTAVVLLALSCSDADYLNAIPEDCTALVQVDVPKMAGGSQFSGRQNLLAGLLGVTDVKDCGISLDAKLYLFESSDGMLGLAAKVASRDKVEDWLNALATKGKATQVVERRGFGFSVLNENWVAGFSGSALLVMGPVVGNAQAGLIQQMANYLSQNADQGICETPMFAKLDSIGTPVAMVAQAHALPEKFVAPFTLDAPADADASQALIAAKMDVADSCLNIRGETFSFNKRIDAALKKSQSIYRPIRGDYVQSMDARSTLGIFMNVQGADFLALLQQTKGLMALLTGINAAVDMDNILRSVDGDMAINVPVVGDKFDITMAAKLAHHTWLKDVDYWKRSCPSGGRILDTGPRQFCYTDGQTVFHFGVSADNQFFAGSTAQLAAGAIGKAPQPLSQAVVSRIAGQKLVAVVSLASINNEAAQAALALLEPMFGKLNTIVYTIDN